MQLDDVSMGTQYEPSGQTTKDEMGVLEEAAVGVAAPLQYFASLKQAGPLGESETPTEFPSCVKLAQA